MKHPTVLQALASIQAYRIHLKINAQIGISERGKVRTSKSNKCFEKAFARWWKQRKPQQCDNLSCLTESGGMTFEAVITSRGGIAASQLQRKILVKVNLKGSSMTKKSEIRKESN